MARWDENHACAARQDSVAESVFVELCARSELQLAPCATSFLPHTDL